MSLVGVFVLRMGYYLEKHQPRLKLIQIPIFPIGIEGREYQLIHLEVLDQEGLNFALFIMQQQGVAHQRPVARVQFVVILCNFRDHVSSIGLEG